MEKGEIAPFEQFHLFPQCFPIAFFFTVSKRVYMKGRKMFWDNIVGDGENAFTTFSKNESLFFSVALNLSSVIAFNLDKSRISLFRHSHCNHLAKYCIVWCLMLFSTIFQLCPGDQCTSAPIHAYLEFF